MDTDLLETIRAVHAGRKRIPPEVAAELAMHTAEDQLTARELEVLTLIAKGNANKEIAAQLAVAEDTVKATSATSSRSWERTTARTPSPLLCSAESSNCESPKSGVEHSLLIMFQKHRDSRKLKMGLFVQRLFSTFAGGWPGAGLLIQRLLVGAALEYCVVATVTSTVAVPRVIGALAGLLLIAGLWTPVAGVVTACAEAWIAFSSPAHAAIPAALAVLGMTLALIGPGEWSVDARLYGRKHFVPPEL